MGALVGISLLIFPKVTVEPKSREAIRLRLIRFCLVFSPYVHMFHFHCPTPYVKSNYLLSSEGVQPAFIVNEPMSMQGAALVASCSAQGPTWLTKDQHFIFNASLLCYPGNGSKFNDILLMEEGRGISPTVLPQ